jgi:xanthosine utilization system XapX-like protein
MDLGNFTLNPVTLALLILGIVEFIKKFGVTGNKLTLISMGVGIVFAVIYKFRDIYPPTEPYIEIAFFGLAAGLCASGIYNFVNVRFPVQTKTSLKYTKVVQTRIPPTDQAPDREKEVQ